MLIIHNPKDETSVCTVETPYGIVEIQRLYESSIKQDFVRVATQRALTVF